MPNQIYHEKQLYKEPNQYIGIVEDQIQEGEQFKLERLVKILLQNQGQSVHNLVKVVVDAVFQFMDGMHQKDDITMVILQVEQYSTDITNFNSPVIHS